jgi:hypothetical protein
MTGDHITILFAIACVLAAAIWFYNARETQRQNAQTLVYARFVGVWPVLPLTPFDDSVQARADALREAFAAHGNTNAVVAEYIYSMPINGSPMAAVQWSQFLMEASKDYLVRVDQFIAKKTKEDQRASATHIGGQTAFTITPVTNKEFLNL